MNYELTWYPPAGQRWPGGGTAYEWTQDRDGNDDRMVAAGYHPNPQTTYSPFGIVDFSPGGTGQYHNDHRGGFSSDRYGKEYYHVHPAETQLRNQGVGGGATRGQYGQFGFLDYGTTYTPYTGRGFGNRWGGGRSDVRSTCKECLS